MPYPLQCGHFGVEVRAAINPYSYTNRRGSIWISPSFPNGYANGSTHHRTNRAPWSLGGEIQYALSNHVEAFGEVTYNHALGKPQNPTFNGILAHETYTRFKALGFYLGGRYYFPRSCWGSSFFIAVKAGALYYDSRRYHPTVVSPTVFDFNKNFYTRSTFVPSAGFQLGFDFLLCDGFSLTVTTEVLFSGPQKYNDNIVPPTNTFGVTRIIAGQNGSVLSYPISIGIRRTF